MRRGWLVIKGFSLVEVLLAVVVLALTVTALVGAIIYGQQTTAVAGALSRAVFVAEEGLEAARNMRDSAYANLTAGTSGLAISANKWIFSGSSDVTDIFTRQVSVVPVDSVRNRVTTTITWQQTLSRSGTMSLVTYLTNWRRSGSGSVPQVPETTLDLPGPGSGTEIALYTSGGSIYAIVGRISSSDKELYVVDVTSPATPTITGSLEIGSSVNDLKVIGSNVYLATTDNSAELQVVSLAVPTLPVLIGSLNLGGNADAQTIAGSGSNVYIGRASSSEPEINSVTIAVPALPVSLSTLEVGDTVWKLSLDSTGSYLYVAGGNNSKEFSIVSISNPLSISEVGSINISGTSDGTAIEKVANYAAIGLDDGNFYMIDATTPSAPTLISSALDIGNKINDLVIGPGDNYIFAGSSTVNQEITIIDISTPTTPASFTTVNLSNEVTGLIWESTANRIYGTATNNTAEFIVVKSP